MEAKSLITFGVQSMEFHEYAEIFPLMSGQDFEELKASLSRTGFDPQIPIIVFEGKILDGRNRWRACEELAIEPSIITFEGSDPIEFVLKHNLARRQLTDGQRSLAASRFAKLRVGQNGKSNTQRCVTETQAQAAQRFNISQRSVTAARKVIENGSAQLQKAVEEGRIGVNVAEKFVGFTHREQADIALEEDEKKRRQKIKEAKLKAKERAYIEKEQRKEVAGFFLESPLVKISGVNLGPFSLKTWAKLTAAEKERTIAVGFDNDKTGLNEQTGDAIEWARHSHNVVTGCKHNCPYCYARDIANSEKMAQIYPFAFEPTFHPARLGGPGNVKIPNEARGDLSYKNIFANSMSDLFGQWVPAEWIDATIEMARRNPKWNFLTLTKFPIRAAEFQFPENWWLGTTVDAQTRVASAEKAFTKIRCKTNWLSCEPLLTPLKFKRLDLFQWIVIGGASSSEKTPSWIPPFDWVTDLQQQARQAGCRIYHKTNLGLTNEIRIKEFPWQTPKERTLPKAFRYLSDM